MYRSCNAANVKCPPDRPLNQEGPYDAVIYMPGFRLNACDPGTDWAVCDVGMCCQRSCEGVACPAGTQRTDSSRYSPVPRCHAPAANETVRHACDLERCCEEVESTPELSFAALDAQINAYITQPAVAGPAFSLTMVSQGVPVRTQGYGTLTRSASSSRSAVSASEDTLYHMASISKTFTALAMMQMVEQGKCSLNDTLVSHLPEFKLKDPRHKQILLWHVLSHTSGLPDVDEYEFYATPNCTGPGNDLDRYIQKLCDLKSMAGEELVDKGKMLSDPGTTYRYSNLGFDILAAVIARLSGEPDYATYIRKNILTPLGMRDTVTLIGDADATLLAPPHVLSTWDPSSARPIDPPRMAPDHIYPDNCIHAASSDVTSSAADMLKYVLMQLNRGTSSGTEAEAAAAPTQLLSETSWETMMKQIVSTDDDDPDPSEVYQQTVGMSWFGGEFEGHETLSHDGEDDGFLTQMVLVPECGAAVVWMSNGDDEATTNAGQVDSSLANITQAALALAVAGCHERGAPAH